MIREGREQPVYDLNREYTDFDHIDQDLRELYEPFQRMILQMRDKIEAGDYTLLIGSDMGGRIPTLIFHRFLSEIYRTRGLEERLITLCFSRCYSHDTEIYQQYLENVKGEIEKKIKDQQWDKSKSALIITEVISRGVSQQPWAVILNDLKIKYDFAAVGVTGAKKSKIDNLEQSLGGEIFYGMSKTPEIYYESRNLPYGMKHSRDLNSTHLVRDMSKPQKEVGQLRQEVNIVAQKLIDWYQQSNVETK